MKQLIQLLLKFLWSFVKPQAAALPIQSDQMTEKIISEPEDDDEDLLNAAEQDGAIAKNTKYTDTTIETAPTPTDTAAVPVQTQQNIIFHIAGGHYAGFPGKRSPEKANGKRFYEWHSNWMFANALSITASKLGFAARNVTQNINTEKIGLIERVNLINNSVLSPNEIAIEIHSNAAKVPNPDKDWANYKHRGIEVWFFHDSPVGEWVAEIFQRHLIQHTGAVNRGIKSMAKKQFYFLRKTTIPAVLIEIEFFNNFESLLVIEDKLFREKVNNALLSAMHEINAQGLPKFQTFASSSAQNYNHLVGKRIRAERVGEQSIEGTVISVQGTQVEIQNPIGVVQIIDILNYTILIAPKIIEMLLSIVNLINSLFGGEEGRQRRAARRLERNEKSNSN